jgi:transcriptional regulator with XRE-family HTH domain
VPDGPSLTALVFSLATTAEAATLSTRLDHDVVGRYCAPGHTKGKWVNAVSDGHADKRTREAGLTPEQRHQRECSVSTWSQRKVTQPTDPPATNKPLVSLDDPEVFAGEDMRAALVARDVTRIYRLLYRRGVAQREIARRTGQSQSEVSDILKGRTVRDVTVLERIADGLGIARARMRLAGVAGSEEGSYGEEGMIARAPEEVIAAMFRRHLLALGAVSAVGIAAVGELVELPGLVPVALPSQLSYDHVRQVRDLTQRLGEAGNTCVAGPEVLSAAAVWAEQLLGVAGAELVRRALRVAVAELHIEAGWAGFDFGRYDRAMYHFAVALELATEAGDAYLQSTALQYAGAATVEHGHPDDGLKMLQFSLVKAWDIPRDEQRAVVVGQSGRAAQEACVRASAVIAMVDLGKLDAADVEVAKSRQLWSPTRADRFGDVDRPAALRALRRGRLDAAESLAAASVRRWEGISQISRTDSGVVLATIHVRAGEPDGLRLAHGAITAVTKISSVRVRRRLLLLADALAARPGADAKDLSRMAHQAAGVRV